MKINLRLKKGWKYSVENYVKDYCIYCGAKLWIAPHGAIYCDKVHTFIRVGETENECERMSLGISPDD